MKKPFSSFPNLFGYHEIGYYEISKGLIIDGSRVLKRNVCESCGPCRFSVSLSRLIRFLRLSDRISRTHAPTWNWRSSFAPVLNSVPLLGTHELSNFPVRSAQKNYGLQSRPSESIRLMKLHSRRSGTGRTFAVLPMRKASHIFRRRLRGVGAICRKRFLMSNDSNDEVNYDACRGTPRARNQSKNFIMDNFRGLMLFTSLTRSNAPPLCYSFSYNNRRIKYALNAYRAQALLRISWISITGVEVRVITRAFPSREVKMPRNAGGWRNAKQSRH